VIRGFVYGILSGGVISALGLGLASHFSEPPGAAVIAPGSVTVPADAAPKAIIPDDPAAKPAADSAQPGAAPSLTPSDPAPDPTLAQPVPDAPPGAVVPAAPPGAVVPVAPAIETPANAAPAPGPSDPQKPDQPEGGAALTPVPNTVAKPTTDLATTDLAATPPITKATSPDASPGEVLANSDAPESLTPDPAPDAPAVLATVDPDPVIQQPAATPAPQAVTAEQAPQVSPAPAAPPKVARGEVPETPVAPVVDPSVPKLAAIAPAPVVPSDPDALPQVIADTTPVQDQPPPPPVKSSKPRILTEDAPLEDAVTATLAPAKPLGDAVDGVVTGRLPRIGDSAAAATDSADVTSPPLTEFAQVFENPDQKPLFSIVLIDTGGPDVDRKALATLPFAVSFALDPLAENVQTYADIYRAGGKEVLMLATGIPDGATAADLEVSLAALSDALPQAVAVMEQPVPVFQDDRPLATQIVPILAAQGRGLVTWDQGLNAADQVALREGLPSATAFRSLDGEDEGEDQIRRYLDRAAFRAAQDGHVVVVGTTRAQTVQAVTDWSIEGRSESVALAPISAVLKGN
jgi:uncharacterized protein